MSAKRIGIPEDLEFDPTYERHRRVAAYLLGMALNAMKGTHLVWEDSPDMRVLAENLKEVALNNGIVSFDEWHHAPACRANNWSRTALPTGPCTCGAEKWKIR